MAKLIFQESLLQASVSHDPSQICGEASEHVDRATKKLELISS